MFLITSPTGPSLATTFTVAGPSSTLPLRILSSYRSFENIFEASSKVRRRVHNFNPDLNVSVVPPDAVPANCDEGSNGWYVLSMPHPWEETIQLGPTWDDCVSMLEPWEWMLLQPIHLHQQSPFKIYQPLSEAPSATLVSNGTAVPTISKALPAGSLPLAIAVGNEQIIRGQCPIPRFNPRSYCTESYGMIGGLLFLRQMCLYCGHLQLLLLHQMHCNNLGLVTKVYKLLSFRLAPRQAALHSEFDVLATIHALLNDFPLPREIQHVKGHQDDHKAYKDLHLSAQLNCNADLLATDKLTKF
jgi:hypothetical protein